MFFSGIGPRGLSSSFFLPLALPPRCGLASGPKLRLARSGAGALRESKGRGPPKTTAGAARSRRRPVGPGRAAGPRSARSAILAGARFADRERPSVVRLSVELLDRLFGVRAIDEFDEREPSRAAGFPIDRQHDLRGRRDGAEVGAQVGFSRAVGEITDEQTDGQSTVS